MTLISLEDAKAEVRKAVSDFKTRYDINYRLNNLPSVEIEDEAEQTEPCDKCVFVKGSGWCDNCNGKPKGLDALPNSRKAEQHKPNDDDCKGCIYDNGKNLMACMNCKGKQTDCAWK